MTDEITHRGNSVAGALQMIVNTEIPELKSWVNTDSAEALRQLRENKQTRAGQVKQLVTESARACSTAALPLQ